jgi:hypothetical protein
MNRYTIHSKGGDSAQVDPFFNDFALMEKYPEFAHQLRRYIESPRKFNSALKEPEKKK